MTQDSSPPIERLTAVMARLRHPTRGCPWDVEQTFATIAPYTIEEAYEVADAIERRDMAGLKEELGDLLFQVVFHARMAEEAGLFDFDAVAAALSEKMVRRHPHVFADAEIAGSAAQTVAWEAHKASERHGGSDAPAGALDGVPVGLPALTRAQKIQGRAARVGFDWPDAGPALDKIVEEVDELRAEINTGGAPARLEEEIGDLLFACVNAARWAKVDAESALRRAAAKFERRFRRVEAALAARGKRPEDSTLAEMDALWDEAKAREREYNHD
ncbi:MAG TPA: nucleoside triphosphate pyrophosphohydrolase [Alphaproteobacteria bacterium]|nr:nucleoside triphosphate pyrophosphohydrolase [Alphaproteobacteria bacterium]